MGIGVILRKLVFGGRTLLFIYTLIVCPTCFRGNILTYKSAFRTVFIDLGLLVLMKMYTDFIVFSCELECTFHFLKG